MRLFVSRTSPLCRQLPVSHSLLNAVGAASAAALMSSRAPLRVSPSFADADARAAYAEAGWLPDVYPAEPQPRDRRVRSQFEDHLRLLSERNVEVADTGELAQLVYCRCVGEITKELDISASKLPSIEASYIGSWPRRSSNTGWKCRPGRTAFAVAILPIAASIPIFRVNALLDRDIQAGFD